MVQGLHSRMRVQKDFIPKPNLIWIFCGIMTLKTHTIKKKDESKNQVWEWEETPEVVAAIEQLQKSSQVVKSLQPVKKLHVGNTNYAPLKNKNDS